PRGRAARSPRAGRVAGPPPRRDAAPAARMAAGTARAPADAARAASRAADRGRAHMSDDLRALFLRHVCQTSDDPMGLVVQDARGATIRDAEGREYLDLLAGMGVADVGHAHPEEVGAVGEQGDGRLHVLIDGTLVTTC